MNFQKSGEFSKIWRIFKNLENFQKSGEFSKKVICENKRIKPENLDL